MSKDQDKRIEEEAIKIATNPKNDQRHLLIGHLRNKLAIAQDNLDWLQHMQKDRSLSIKEVNAFKDIKLAITSMIAATRNDVCGWFMEE